MRKNAEFQKIRHGGIRIRNRHLILNYQNTQIDQPRLGVVIAKRQVARAVDRNRIKRRVKEWFRLKKSHLIAQDYVIIVTQSARDLSSVGLNQCLDSLLQKANSQFAN